MHETENPQPNEDGQPETTPQLDNPAAERHAQDAKKQRLKAKALQETNSQLTAQLEAANTLLTAARQQLADNQLEGVLQKPRGFWKLGNHPDTYFDEAGHLDAKRLSEDVNQAVTDYGLATPERLDYPVGGVGTPVQPATSWQSTLNNAAK